MTALAWGDPGAAGYARANIATYSSHGVSFQANKQVGPRFVAFLNDLWSRGYHFVTVGGYDKRPITDGTGWSNHAYGAAIDIDPTKNPRYPNAAGGPFALPANVGAVAAKYGLDWGGNYVNTKDTMHVEDATAPRSPNAVASHTIQPTVGNMGAPTPGGNLPYGTINVRGDLRQALLEVGLESVAVIVLVVIAGQSPRGAKISLWIVVTLWIVAAIVHYAGSL